MIEHPVLWTGFGLHFTKHRKTNIAITTKRKSVHRADRYADAAANATRCGIVQSLLFEGVTHHIDANLTVA